MAVPSITSETQSVERERLVSLINSMADGVVAVDEHANVILDINVVAENQPIGQLLRLVDKNNQTVNVEKLILSCKLPTSTREYRLAYSVNDKINLYISIAPVHLGYGKKGQRGFVLLLRDITREKSLEEERDEFISVVSHELRTPIAIAEGNISNAQLIAERTEGIPQLILDSLKSAYDQTTFLSGLINDLATLSRAERGKLEIIPTAMNISTFLDSLKKQYEPEASAKQLTLQCIADERLELLYSSELYVKEVLQNFITNAIKYTDSGSVTIKASQEEKGVLFEVTDSGIGISKTDQEKVFDKFFRSEDYRTRQHNGTGLGLYVTMKLARMLHATVELESELNKGSTFRIHIPHLAMPKPDKNTNKVA
jgi:two-component system, OmpR family, phosphate regulon sensor histidine kinase PhoR